MALETTEAIILKTYNWSESSRTVHLLTSRFGKISIMDKGGRSLKSRRGRLMPFARMEIGFFKSEKSSVGYLSTVELFELFSFEADGTLGRLAYGSAACELLGLLLPEDEAQPELYDYLINYLRLMDKIDKQFIPACFLTFFLRLLSHLGFHPSLEYCIVSSEPKAAFVSAEHSAMFSPGRGGIVSPACQKAGEYYIDLPLADLDLLISLQTASLNEAAQVRVGFTHAGRMIEVLAKFLSYQADTGANLKSIAFLEKLKNSQLNG